MENKTCKYCSKEFTVEDEDLEFYSKVSPTFAGREFAIPSPTLCPDCRAIRRYIWRNERALYRRKSDKTGKDIVAIYAPDKTDYKVYSVSEWWKDDWDATDYSRDFDFSRPFFEQFGELIKSVPAMGLRNTKTENCDFVNYTSESKNCYMCAVCYSGTEDSLYSYWIYTSKNCIDCSFIDHNENCYEIVTSNRNYGCRYSLRVNDCRDCYFCVDLTACSNCFMCSNMNHKQYCFKNEQLTKEEYEERMKRINLGSYSIICDLQKEFDEFKKNQIVKYANKINCEDCEGDDLFECKDIKDSFSCIRLENSKYSMGGASGVSRYVWDAMGGGYEWVLESQHTGFGNNLLFCSGVLYCSNMLYCDNCQNSRDCFGCAGLKSKQFCIFNKQYTKEEYEKLTAKIIPHMQETGEWGEFFPYELCPFGYNETFSQLYSPKTKEQALAEGFKWQDNDFATEYSGDSYKPLDDIKEYSNQNKREELLNGIIKCEVSGKPFKITPQELAFYIKQGIPIPQRHYDVRFQKRFRWRNPHKLYHRQCMNEGCTNEFETTYAPDRPEKVYCEKCYQNIIK